MKQESIEINVYGKVQGVWFRKHTEIEAKKLMLVGYVENKMDGSVYIKAQGESAKISTLLKWCYQGAPESEVVDVKYRYCDKIETFTDFSIRR